MKKVLLVLLLSCKGSPSQNHPEMGASEAAAWATDLAGEWMECWGEITPDHWSSYRCSPGPSRQTPLVVCYQGWCRLVRWSGEVCFPPFKK